MDIEKFIKEAPWKLAVTMPRWPHQYILLKWVRPRGFEQEFFELARRIFEEGTDEDWEGIRIVRYYRIGGYRYWSMEDCIEDTDLINRAKDR